MRTTHILLFLVCGSLSLLGETPNAPDPAAPVTPAVKSAAFVRLDRAEPTYPNYRKVFLAGLALDATARALDAYSTHRALQQKGNQEMFLPKAIVNSQPLLYGYSASILVSQYMGYRFLAAHHHEKMGRWLPYVDSALVLPFTIHNLALCSQGQ